VATDSFKYPVELASTLSDSLRSAKQELVTRWLDRISARVAISTKRVFPTHELLNHVPLLIEGIAGYLKRPERDIDGRAPVVAKAMELGALRHAQGFDAYELLKEYEMLGEIIFDFLTSTAEQIRDNFPRRDFLACWQRVFQAIALANACSMLGESWTDEAERKEFDAIIAKNAESLKRVLANLESLSRTQTDARHCRHVLLPEAANEAIRELEAAAKAKGVDVRIADDLPRIEVDAATVELCLMNYLSNGIKYSDSSKGERWVTVEAAVEGPNTERDREIVIRVADNGIGVPADKREQLFEEYYRAHADTVTGADGSGLGLSIVRETVESIGGRAWAEFPEGEGSVFAFSLPSRRRDDVEATSKRPESEKTPAG